jgi:hypothetical protein
MTGRRILVAAYAFVRDPRRGHQEIAVDEPARLLLAAAGSHGSTTLTSRSSSTGGPTARFPIDLSTTFKIDALVAVITRATSRNWPAADRTSKWRSPGTRSSWHVVGTNTTSTSSHALRQPIPLRVR